MLCSRPRPGFYVFPAPLSSWEACAGVASAAAWIIWYAGGTMSPTWCQHLKCVTPLGLKSGCTATQGCHEQCFERDVRCVDPLAARCMPLFGRWHCEATRIRQGPAGGRIAEVHNQRHGAVLGGKGCFVRHALCLGGSRGKNTWQWVHGGNAVGEKQAMRSASQRIWLEMQSSSSSILYTALLPGSR